MRGGIAPTETRERPTNDVEVAAPGLERGFDKVLDRQPPMLRSSVPDDANRAYDRIAGRSASKNKKSVGTALGKHYDVCSVARAEKCVRTVIRDVEVVLPGQLGRGGVNDVVVLVPMPPVLVPAPAVRIEALHPALQSQVGHNTSRKYANQHEALGTAVRTTWHGTVSRHGTVEKPGEERRHKSKNK